MKPALKSELHKAINAFLEKTEAHDDRPNGYVHEAICDHMADAAEAVYDASHAAATYAEQETKVSP